MENKGKLLKKRFLCLYLLLFPCIDLLLIRFVCFLNILPGVYILPEDILLYLWPLWFFLIIFSCAGGIAALSVFGGLYAAKMSLIEASIWNLLIKIFYLCVHICLFLFVVEIWDNSIIGLEFIMLWWIPPLFSLCFLVISGAFSAIIYGNSCKKGIWPIGIVIFFDFMSFILGIDLVIALIHICGCCMIK